MAAPATRRVDRGRGHSYILDGEPVDGVTSIIRDGLPKPALISWAARTVAGYAVDRWSELEAKPSSERLRELERAPYADRDRQAARGTAIHGFAARLAAGEEVDVPEDVAGHVDSYLRFAEEWKVREEAVEAVVINRRWRYAGTLDLLARVAGDDRDLWLLDLKTGGSGIWPEVALQLAAYRHAEAIVLPDGQEIPMPAVARCAAVWVRADGYDVVPVDAGDEAFRVFLYAQQTASFVRDPRERWVGAALEAAS